jgi:hypothetical protein
MKYLDDQILAEAYSKILESSPDTTREYGENEIEQDQDFEKDLDVNPSDVEKDNSHPQLHVFGYGQLSPKYIIENCQRYINNLKSLLEETNHNDPEETYFGLSNQTSLLAEHAKALDEYAKSLFRKRKKELDAKRK